MLEHQHDFERKAPSLQSSGFAREILLENHVKSFEVPTGEQAIISDREDSLRLKIYANSFRSLVVRTLEPPSRVTALLLRTVLASLLLALDYDFENRACPHTHDDSVVPEANTLHVAFRCQNSLVGVHIPPHIADPQSFERLNI